MAQLLRKIILSTVLNINKRGLRISSRVSTFYEADRKGGYKDTRTPPSLAERIKNGMAELKTEIAIWSEEMKESFDGDPTFIYRPGEVDLAWRFEDEASLQQWIVTADKDHNEGFSSCSLTSTNYGRGLFSGELSLRVPKDGRVKRAGYCNIKTTQPRKSFKRETYLNWGPYNMLVMKVRGDGRSYLLNIHTKGYFDITWNDMYHYVLFTRGGPYWQIVKIPFSKFFMGSKGRIQDNQNPIPLENVTSFGITATERYAGEFSLEIDYIGLEYDPSHTENFAYESYQLERGIANY